MPMECLGSTSITHNCVISSLNHQRFGNKILALYSNYINIVLRNVSTPPGISCTAPGKNRAISDNVKTLFVCCRYDTLIETLLVP